MTRKLIVVEDDPAMIQLVRTILEKGDYEVSSVDGVEALELIGQEKPDLVLLDLMLPGISGWEIYQHMKDDDQMKDIPVIVVTARAQQIDRVLALHLARVQAYITKPYTADQLLDSIRMVLGDEVRPPQPE